MKVEGQLESYHGYSGAHGCRMLTARSQDAQRERREAKKWSPLCRGVHCFLPAATATYQPQSQRNTPRITENFRVGKAFTSIICLSRATVTMPACLHGNNTNLGPVSLSNDLRKRALKCLTRLGW